MSSGSSSSTGPGRPERIRQNASRITSGSFSGSFRHQAFLVTVLTMSGMSTHWKGSCFSWPTLAWPTTHSTGMESMKAVYRPVTKLVAPGPAEQIARAISCFARW